MKVRGGNCGLENHKLEKILSDLEDMTLNHDSRCKAIQDKRRELELLEFFPSRSVSSQDLLGVIIVSWNKHFF